MNMRPGILSGYHVCGDDLGEVLWYPPGSYAVFPYLLQGRLDIPSAPILAYEKFHELLSATCACNRGNLSTVFCTALNWVQ